MDADVVVVGAGHNGLICAAYLARAGVDTILVEARDDVGGCASTVTDLGARFNICNCDHTMIRAMPVIDELELSAYGLEYLEADVSGINAFYDAAPTWLLFHEADRTLDELAATYPRQIDGYRRYLDDALPVAELVLAMARTKPSLVRMTGTAIRKRTRGAARLLEWSRMSVNDVFARYFDDWHLTAPAISTGPTVWGVAPHVAGTGMAALNYANRHLVKTGRPRGGSGALPDATRSAFEAAGGRVRCGSRVHRLLVRDGQVAGTVLDDGSLLRAPVVVAACDPKRVYVDWVDDPPRAARRAVARWLAMPVEDGYESKIDAIVRDVPTYRHQSVIHQRHPGAELAGPTTVVSPHPDQLAEAHLGRELGTVATEPTLLANVPSALDPTMRTATGDHVLSLEVLYTPYALRGGWPDSTEPRRWLDLWGRFVEPGTLDRIVDWRVMTPDKYESQFSMYRGHTPSFSTTPLRALLGLNREQTRYRSPIAGLYLSGAGTFPGAGVFGAPGRNTAEVVLSDLRGPVARRISPLRRRVMAV